MMTCNTILGSWQDILRKTFLASGKQNHQMFLPMLVHEACFGVCIKGWPWAAADPAASLGPSLLTTIITAVRPPQGRVPAPPPMPSHAYFVLPNCKSCVLREEQSLSGREGSRSSPSAWAPPGGSEKVGGNVSPLPWEWPHHPHPWSSQRLAA